MDTKLSKVLEEGHYIGNLEIDSDEHYDQELEASVEKILVRLGEDPSRKGLKRTPQRVAKAMAFLTSGYNITVEEVVKDALFEDGCEEMVIVKDMEFYSLCEHHMLPFFGRAHVGYLPKGRIVGLSKIARVVDIFARRLQVQERLTNQIATGLMSVLSARGVGVVLEACHFCMLMRGVQKQNSQTITSAMLGTFRQDPRTRAEFMELIRRS